MEIYLDYNASMPVDPRVLEYMFQIYRGVIGNPDSRTHNFGNNARNIIEEARKNIASILSRNTNEIYFTSGSTESSNIAIQGLREFAQETNKKHIITTTIEHKAVLDTIKMLQKQGYDIDFINPNQDGRIDANEVISKLREDTLLVSVMHVNNETGIIQPVKEIGEELDKRGILFHIDATQSFGKLVDEIKELKYDMLSMSAHKIGGPQGVGALVLKRKKYRLPPITPVFFGGGQEHGIRPGTVPVALVGALGKACELLINEYKKNNHQCALLKTKIIQLLNESKIEYVFNGNQEYAMNNTLNISLKGVSSEALMLSSKSICGISNGSACTSSSYEPSYVLRAMDIPEDQINNAIRISWGADLNENDVIDNLKVLFENAKTLAF